MGKPPDVICRLYDREEGSVRKRRKSGGQKATHARTVAGPGARDGEKSQGGDGEAGMEPLGAEKNAAAIRQREARAGDGVGTPWHLHHRAQRRVPLALG